MSNRLSIVLGLIVLAVTFLLCRSCGVAPMPMGAAAKAAPEPAPATTPLPGVAAEPPDAPPPARDPAASESAAVAAAAAPIAAAAAVPSSRAVARQKITDLLTQRRIEFVTNRNVLTPGSLPVLAEIGTILAGEPDTVFEVSGHTDSQGDARTNRALSVSRARAVVDALVAEGLKKERFIIRGYGSAKPIADNATPAGRQANRRIEFKQVGE